MPADKKIVLWILIPIISILSLVCMYYKYEINKTQTFINAVIENYQIKKINFQHELDDYNTNKLDILEAAYEDNLKKLFSEEQLIELSRSQWEYSISVNGQRIDNEIITINDESLVIQLTELANEDDLMPKNLMNKGRLSYWDDGDFLESHIQLHSNFPYEINKTSDIDGTVIKYLFKSINSQSTIQLLLSPPLSERLGLWNSNIEIIIEENKEL